LNHFNSFYLIPNLKVDNVSVSLKEDGEQLIIKVVLELPPRDSCKIRVSLLSRYGMWDDYLIYEFK